MTNNIFLCLTSFREGAHIIYGYFVFISGGVDLSYSTSIVPNMFTEKVILLAYG